MKKLTAILLAVMLVLSLSITAFAAETFNGTITVNGAVDNATYTLYKIFDIETISEGVTAYVIPEGRDYSTAGNFSELFDTNTITNGTDSKTYVTVKNGTTDTAIFNWAKEQAKEDVTPFKGNDETLQTATGANGTATFSGLTAGYYFVKSEVGTGNVAMLVDTNTDVSVNEKNSNAGWGDNGGKKTTNGETFYAGDEIYYELKYENAVNYDGGKQVTSYHVEDTMENGITLKEDSIRVLVGTVDVTNEVTNKSTTSQGFSFDIEWVNADKTSKYTTNPSVITVTYTATMGNSQIADGITNTAKIYPDTNKEPGTDTEQKTDVYTGQIILTKIAAKANPDDADVPLSGAKFKVKVGDKYLKQEGTEGHYTYTEVAAEQATEFTTDANGLITLTGLKEGTYTFVETAAPAGYNLPAPDDNHFEVSLTLKDAEGIVNVAGMRNDTTKIENSTAAAMPMTGGMGTTLFYVVGSLLAVGAMVMLITKKRMQAVQ